MAFLKSGNPTLTEKIFDTSIVDYGQGGVMTLRAAHPDVPLLIGGRDLAKAEEAAAQIGGTEGVVPDPAADGLGLGERPVSADAGRPISRRELLGASAMLGLGIGLGVGLSPVLAAVPKAADTFPVRRAQINANGVSLHVIEQGQGPAVLFCHGFPDTSETWRSQMRALAEAGYRAVALDMRGFGASYAPSDVNLYSSLYLVGDLVGVLDALGIESAVLVSHDWGSAAAHGAMVMRPDRFRAIVSLSIPFQPRGELSMWDGLRKAGLEDRHYGFDMMKPDAEARFAPARKTIPSILYWLSASPPPGTGWDPLDPARNMLRPSPVEVPSWANPDYVQHTIRSFEKTGFHGGLSYYRAVQITFDLTAAFKGALIRQPSLYIYGAEDGLAHLFHPTPPTVQELRRNAPGLVDVVGLKNVGHWPQHEGADRVNAELLKFLDAIGSPKASDAPGRGGV